MRHPRTLLLMVPPLLAVIPAVPADAAGPAADPYGLAAAPIYQSDHWKLDDGSEPKRLGRRTDPGRDPFEFRLHAGPAADPYGGAITAPQASGSEVSFGHPAASPRRLSPQSQASTGPPSPA